MLNPVWRRRPDCTTFIQLRNDSQLLKQVILISTKRCGHKGCRINEVHCEVGSNWAHAEHSQNQGETNPYVPSVCISAQATYTSIASINSFAKVSWVSPLVEMIWNENRKSDSQQHPESVSLPKYSVVRQPSMKRTKPTSLFVPHSFPF